MRDTGPNPIADQFKFAPAGTPVPPGYNTVDPDVMPPVLDETRMPDGETWRICMSGPVDHDKRDAWFIVACGIWLVMVGSACWALGNL